LWAVNKKHQNEADLKKQKKRFKLPWRPSGEIWRENGLGFGASIGLSAVKTASKCISYI
jgi:hypothetical protein